MFYHRCHCNCRDLVLFVDRLPLLCGPYVLRRCLRREDVWCGGFTRDGAYDFVWDSVGLMTGKYTIYYFQFQEVVGCVCMLNFGSPAMTIFAQTTTTIPGSS